MWRWPVLAAFLGRVGWIAGIAMIDGTYGVEDAEHELEEFPHRVGETWFVPAGGDRWPSDEDCH